MWKTCVVTQVWEQTNILNNGVWTIWVMIKRDIIQLLISPRRRLTCTNTSNYVKSDPVAQCPGTVIYIYLFPRIAGPFDHQSEISIPFPICLNCTNRWVSLQLPLSLHSTHPPVIKLKFPLQTRPCKRQAILVNWYSESLNHTAQLSHACTTSPRGQQSPKRSPQICKVKQLF